MVDGTHTQELQRKLTQMIVQLVFEFEWQQEDYSQKSQTWPQQSMEDLQNLIHGLSLQQAEVIS